ncbi:hypothetical protein [Niabella ginsengisoli]|nr:hypothetical protein [Niabella ginsengisoli]
MVAISALTGINYKKFLQPILELLPDGEPFYEDDSISDLPEKFL